MPRRVVAIHQPNFFPWLGFFDKIHKADKFVLLDNVQFQKTGGTWTNRVKIAVNGEPQWLSVPVVRSYHGVRLIKDMGINNSVAWREKMCKTIEQNYRKSIFYKDVRDYIRFLINYSTDSLCAFNIHAITSLVEYLGLDNSKLIVGSTLNAKGNATDLLIAMTEELGGDAYLCGGGAEGYQEDEKFRENGLELLHQNFEHPVYSQQGREFIPGLSILDVLFNCGKDAVKKMLDTSKSDWQKFL